MKHAALTDEVVERTALYALGALTQIEARAFEDHLADGCEVCQSELDEYQLTVEALAVAAADEEPSPAVHHRLLESIGDTPTAGEPEEATASEPLIPDAQAFVSLRDGDDGWELSRELALGAFDLHRVAGQRRGDAAGNSDGQFSNT